MSGIDIILASVWLFMGMFSIGSSWPDTGPVYRPGSSEEDKAKQYDNYYANQAEWAKRTWPWGLVMLVLLVLTAARLIALW